MRTCESPITTPHIELVEELIRSYGRDIIKLDQIDVTFHQKKKRTITAVKDVTIHIQEGDIYGIVGYSGAGEINPCTWVLTSYKSHLQGKNYH